MRGNGSICLGWTCLASKYSLVSRESLTFNRGASCLNIFVLWPSMRTLAQLSTSPEIKVLHSFRFLHNFLFFLDFRSELGSREQSIYEICRVGSVNFYGRCKFK